MKGGILITSTGFLKAHVFTSNAQIPLRNTAIVITAEDGTGIAMRLTDRSGLIRTIEIPVPAKAASLTPDSDEIPYTIVNLYARKKGYEPIYAEHLQIFAGTTTFQDLEMIPLPEFPDASSQIIIYDTPSQDL